MVDHDNSPQTPEERELSAKQSELKALETDLIERELALSTLEQELASFEAEYLRVVGARYADLDDLTAQIKEAEAARLPADKSVQEEARAARETATASAAELGRQVTMHAPSAFEPSTALKALYKAAARKMHPDLAATEEQRQRRHAWMVRVNEAYKHQDEAALRTLIAEWDASPDAVEGEGVASDLVRLIRQIASVKTRLETISETIDSLQANELSRYRAKCEEARGAGRDLLGEQAADLDRQIAEAREVLATLRAQGT